MSILKILMMSTFRTYAKTICLVTAVFLLYGLMFYSVLVQTFPYDETEHERYEIVKERAKQRKEAIKEMQIESMNNYD